MAFVADDITVSATICYIEKMNPSLQLPAKSADPLCAAPQLPLPVEAPQPSGLATASNTIPTDDAQLPALAAKTAPEANNVGVSQVRTQAVTTTPATAIRSRPAGGKTAGRIQAEPDEPGTMFVGKKWSSRYSGYRADQESPLGQQAGLRSPGVRTPYACRRRTSTAYA